MAALPNEQDAIARIELEGPIALNPANFTSLQRTPWAGVELASGIKKNQAETPTQRIGESWEISCDPEAPSNIRNIPHLTLAELIARYPEECLSRQLIASGRTTCDILIKLLNADAPLSLQIHPSDSNASLKINECGKPESWLVLSAKPGSGFYLGFSQPIPISVIREKIETETFSPDLLQFVPVSPGDYFEIEPHVPHAIGPGIVLLEPQRIIAGKSGKTWRLWDWNRKYRRDGSIDPQNGTPRELHIKDSIALLDPKSQSGSQYLAKLRRKAETVKPANGVIIEAYPANEWYQTLLIKMEPRSRLKLNASICFGCATILQGSLQATSTKNRQITMRQGESFFLPAQGLPTELANEDQPALLTLVIPAGQGIPKEHSGNISLIFC